MVGYEGESNMKCEKDKEVMVVRRKDMGLGRVRKRQLGECIENGEKENGKIKKKSGKLQVKDMNIDTNGEKEKGKIKKTSGKIQVKDMNIDTKGEKEKGKRKKTSGKLQVKDLNIDTKMCVVNTHKTCQRVSVIVPLKHVWVEDDQPTKFNTDLWLRHVRKHDDTLDWGGDSDEMEMYMRVIQGV